VAWLLQPLLEQKRVREQPEERGERVEGLCHVGLQSGGGRLRPDGVADEVRSHGATEYDEGHLEERLEATFLNEASGELAGDIKHSERRTRRRE
jgi:hypothetical protein